ncbi:MAG: porin [Gammaproteobacteria bacterium]|nr:porin [Gammaproteobacteria bacterium]
MGIARHVAGYAGLLSITCGLAWPLPVMATGLQLGPVEIGGAVRINVLDKSWETREQRFPRADYEFDTLRGELGFDQGRWSGSAQYRLYYYDETDRTTHFLHHAWLGYQLDEESRIRAGVHKVPFGILPFNSHNYFFSLAYYIGLEDDYDLGFKYTHESGPWRWDAAYYVADEGSYHGQSRGSARYSYDVVKSPVSANQEEHQINVRLGYTLDHDEHAHSELGLSLQAGQIPNDISGKRGTHVAAAVHWDGSYGPWSVKLQSLWYRYNLANPPGTDDRIVVMGAYDFPYNVAAEGNLHTIGVSYHWDVNYGWLQGITVYNDSSYLVKAEQSFDNSLHNIAGMSLDLSPFFIYADIAVGKNNAWIGPDFNDALGNGGTDNELNTRLNLNVGLYF